MEFKYFLYGRSWQEPNLPVVLLYDYLINHLRGFIKAVVSSCFLFSYKERYVSLCIL